ncbi:MAG: Crp/Fnr family transcriptional regulator [Flavobacteriales bacterium]|nr:Crp/Fnr family transcriptional regulator [Flavobacteriales bacterium]
MSETNPARAILIEFLQSFPQLSQPAVQALSEMIPVIAPSKGTVLLLEGQVPEECYFVLKGLVRQYVIDDGDERTLKFYTESNGTVSSVHYTDQSPSTFNLICEEDCLIIAGNMEIDARHMEQFPELGLIVKHMLESELNDTRSRFTQFVQASPEERYLHFLQHRKDVHNRVPLHQIASYLGMTPESLSRIRKRIVSSPQ